MPTERLTENLSNYDMRNHTANTEHLKDLEVSFLSGRPRKKHTDGAQYSRTKGLFTTTYGMHLNDNHYFDKE